MAGRKGQKSANATSFGRKSGNKPGRGPLPGAGGRPTDIFKRRMQTLAARAAEAKRLESLLADTNKDHTLFFAAFDRVTEHGFGRPAQSVDVTSGGKPLDADQRTARLSAIIGQLEARAAGR